MTSTINSDVVHQVRFKKKYVVKYLMTIGYCNKSFSINTKDKKLMHSNKT